MSDESDIVFEEIMDDHAMIKQSLRALDAVERTKTILTEWDSFSASHRNRERVTMDKRVMKRIMGQLAKNAELISDLHNDLDAAMTLMEEQKNE